MLNPSITEKAKTVEIMIVRQGNYYFYNRRTNGRTDVASQRISKERAEEIYTNNVNADVISSGPTGDFSNDPCEWSLTIKRTV